jgi:hypothetical protein
MKIASTLLVLIFLASPHLSFCSGDEKQYQVMTVLVEEEQFNVYGHWLTGQVEIVLDGNKVFANGWQVEPMILWEEHFEYESDKEHVEHEEQPIDVLGRNLLADYESALVGGLTQQEAIDAAIDQIHRTEEVEVIRGSHSVSLIYRGQRLTTTFVPEEKGRHKSGMRDELARRVFHMFINRLSNGDLIIVSTFEGGQERIAMNGRPEDVIAELRAATEMTLPITSRNWPRDCRINWWVAEGIRNPLPLSLREGS